MKALLLVALAVGASGSGTADFCAEPRRGPGGSLPRYCESVSGEKISTAYFQMTVPAGAWFAISDKGRRGAMQPDLSMSMLMLSVEVLTPLQSLELQAALAGTCSLNATGTEWSCKTEISKAEVDSDGMLERILIGQEYSIRVRLVERWSGPLVQRYRLAANSVDFPCK